MIFKVKADFNIKLIVIDFNIVKSGILKCNIIFY